MTTAKDAEERFAYGSVLEALSRGLYPDKRHVIREFVQNSYDSIYDLRKKHASELVQPIQISIQPPSILIADHGLGMSQSEVRQYRYLGYSQKERAKHGGFRGIGKYSGLAIAEKIIVDTSPLGVPERYRIIIHADKMMTESAQGRNRPLETVLEEHTEVSSAPAKAEEHYTFVELHHLSREAKSLLDAEVLRAYLAKTAPVPLDPAFGYAKQIERRLRENVPDFLAVNLSIDGEEVYKPYFANCREPEFDPVLYRDDQPAVLAYSWYCQNSEKGQFQLKDLAGLVFRVKNIAVGDGQLARGMLWNSTPERAFYFFGEIHVLDAQVTPSSDRTAFEDNAARERLAGRCLRISSNLNRKAGEESAQRRFDEVLDKGVEIVSRREGQVQARDLPLELKDQAVYEVTKLQEDLQKRLKGPRTPAAVNRAKRLMGRTRRFLSALNRESDGFLDLRTELKFDTKLRALYDCVVEVLREEFADDPDRLERIIRRIHQHAREKLKT
jgi:hypothetical protein